MASRQLAPPRRTSEFRDDPPTREYQLSAESKCVLSMIRIGLDPFVDCESAWRRGQRERTLANLERRGFVERVDGKWRVKT